MTAYGSLDVPDKQEIIIIGHQSSIINHHNLNLNLNGRMQLHVFSCHLLLLSWTKRIVMMMMID
jgi:hypothetical protein